MDVSIAVSLIRGQMGAVVERAVNGAVETVLAEMLKVVGVKFDELKSQVAVMKREMETLQREKILKDKENDNIRAKLRYTELKLKYYRQGVEEELQHVSAAALSNMCTPTTSGFSQSNTATPSCSGQTRTRTTSTSPQTSGRHSGRVQRQSDVCAASVNSPEIVRSILTTSAPSLENNTASNQDSSVNNSAEPKLDWTVPLESNTEGGTVADFQPLSFESEHQSTTGSTTSEVSAHADSSTLNCSPSQVKQELQPDDEVIYIKEEPEAEQDEPSMYDCHVLEDNAPNLKVTKNEIDWSAVQVSGINAASSSSEATMSLMSHLASSVSSPSFSTFTQHVWSRRALGLPEEYKKYRKEQQKRSWMKCREMEKTLPQQQLSEILRERREKTRVRVAKWRAKKKLQEAKAMGGVAGASLALVSGGNQNQQLGPISGLMSGSPVGLLSQENAPLHLQNAYFCNTSSPGHTQPSQAFIDLSSYSSVFLRGAEGGPEGGLGGSSHTSQQQTVTSSSSSYPQIQLTHQNTPLTETNIIE